MSLRLLSFSLVLVALAVFTRPLVSQNPQGPQNAAPLPKWEYKVVKIDARIIFMGVEGGLYTLA